MNGHNFKKRKLLVLKWHSVMEGGRKWWEVEVEILADEDSRQEILRNTPGSQSALKSVEDPEVPKAKSSS